MEHTWLHNLIVALGLLEECSAFPIHLGAGGLWSAGVASPLTPIALGAATLLAAVVLLVGCVCCRQQKGFQEFTDSVVSSQNNLAAVPVSSQASVASELTLFPPLGTTLTQPGDRSSIVQFEPLPDIHVVAAADAARRKPAAFGNSLHHGLSVHDWFVGPIENFPRHQLQYLRELGRGWFGRVVEGKAKNIISGHETSKVIVKILHEDATPTDQSYFLHEAKPYRNLKHPNVLRLVGRCLDTHPFLLLFEDCPSGTLKTFLTNNRVDAENLSQQGLLLQMACGVAAGLLHMVENGFVHTDLAARNCLVASDLTIKVGDYGTSIETFKDEYYCVGDLAIPIRWVAPETLHCTDTTIETKEVTAVANVWSLSVVLWEICEFGKLPYFNLTDEEVIEQVLGQRSTCLPFPSMESQPHVHNLYHLMKVCWVEPEKRPPLRRVVDMLQHLLQHKSSPAHTSANNNNNSTTSLDDFERRWELFKPNTVPKIDNHIGSTSVQASPVKSTPLSRSISLEETVVSAVTPQLESSVLSEKPAPGAPSPQLSLSSSCGGEFVPQPSLSDQKSPSLQNLRGSLDDLTTVKETDTKIPKDTPETVAEEPDFDSWLKGMDTSTEDDVRFVRNVSEALRDLDEVLAQEKTSSSSQNSSAQPSPSQVNSRELKSETSISSQDNRFTLDFRLGQTASSSLLSRNLGILHSNGHESLSLSQHPLESSGSDTEDETWRVRIERGEFSEKVKEKSKSVADLMILTHIDYSDGSDSDSTLDMDSTGSLFKKNGAGRRSFHRKPLQSSLSVTYGSEGNIHQAVLGEEFQETIRRLQESLKDGSKLEAIPDASLSLISTSSTETSENTEKSHFLAKLASENKLKENGDVSALSSTGLNLTPENFLKEDLESTSFCLELRDGNAPTVQVKSLVKALSSEKHLNSSEALESSTSHLGTQNGIIQDCEEKNIFGVMKSPVEDCGKKINGDALPFTSTPVSADKLTASFRDETHNLDSSLFHSQSLSSFGSENNNSPFSSSAENRPPSPTPDDIHRKSSDSSCVILGPFEDSTLDYFRGLKTSFPVMKALDYDDTNELDLEENSIETWDKFLDHAMQPENFPSFSDVSFTKVESESPVSDANASSDCSDILGSSFERSIPEKLCVQSTEVKIHEDKLPQQSLFVPSSCDSSVEQGEKAIVSEISDNVSAGLVVPSVTVIEATPISSGRNTPSDVRSSVSEALSSVTKGSADPLLDLQEVNMNCKQSASKVNTVGFLIPQIFKHDDSSQKFDPNSPFCNQINLSFDASEKHCDIGSSDLELFSSSTSNESESVLGLASDCFSKLDSDVRKDLKPVIPLFSKSFDSKDADTNGELIDDDDDFGLGVAKNLTPDDERSSDSGFRDKGSLSESCEDACDEKYNLEDIEAELEEAFSKGVFARHDSPTSNKGLESDCEVVDESFSVTLTDVEQQRELREAEMSRSIDPCHRLDDLLRGDAIQEQLHVDVESSVDFFGASPALSPVPHNSGWYLHPQNEEEPNSEYLSGNDSSYFSFSLDEEYVNAIRNELREKLPCAQMQKEESLLQLSDEEEHSDQEDDSQSQERTSITIQYKTYPPPLSPILEEGESLCSETSSPLFGYSSSCSEQLSPVFATDQSPSNQGDCNLRHGESEGPAEVDGDLSDDCGDFDESIEHDGFPLDIGIQSGGCVNDADENDGDDDVLVVNTETNVATILESPKPVNKLPFSGNDDDDDELTHHDFVPDFLSVAGSYQFPDRKFGNIDRLRCDLYLDCRPTMLATLPQTEIVDTEDYEEDNEVMTPDSITCEKSLSERTEDSAVGLALSEVMTPDSLVGETQWTSGQMCDSGFGTICTRPPSSDSSEQKSPEPNSLETPEQCDFSIEQGNLTAIDLGSPVALKTEGNETAELSETTHSTEDSESSVSVSSNSVIAVLNHRSNLKGSEDTLSVDSGIHSTSSSAVSKTNFENHILEQKKDIESFILEEQKSTSTLASFYVNFSPEIRSLKPLSLKEIAKNALVKDTIPEGPTHAVTGKRSYLRKQMPLPDVNAFDVKLEESKLEQELKHKDAVAATKGLVEPYLQVEQTLQTLAFSEPEVVERLSFSEPGHIVVGSMIAPLTPSDETFTPGTLAFNDSPEYPREILSPIFKENETCEAESHLMSTSFMSAEDLFDDQDQPTHDWESGSDVCESETASSSSGEFIWKDGDKESSLKAVHAVSDPVSTSSPEEQTCTQTTPEFPMSSILEEEEEEGDGCGSSTCSSDSDDDAEFVPSAWDSQATPSRSALRSPDKKSEQKKNVSFKRQRYHCVYEYPRELSDSDGSELADSPSRRRTWDLGGGSYDLHDWEIAPNEAIVESPGQEDAGVDQINCASSPTRRIFDIYKLSCPDFGFGSTMLSEDGEFFISSSAQPFHTLGEVGPSGSSEFFPGRTLTPGSDDIDVIDGVMDSTPETSRQVASAEVQNWCLPEECSDSDSSDINMVTASEGSFSQPKSEDSSSLSTPMVTANGSSKSSEDSSVYLSLPTNQELQVDSGSDTPLSELSPTSPLSPSSPSHGLGELRHTRDRLKLDLPAVNNAFVLVAPCKKRSVEQVKGEASLLDGEDILEGPGFRANSSCVNESVSVSSDVLRGLSTA